MPDYVTKDSGQRAEFETGMVRDTTEGKPRFDLITPAFLPFEDQLLTRLAMLMTRGAVKYGDRNWEKARTPAELNRFRDSAFRHFMQWFTSADQDEDHAAAVIFNLMGAEYCWYHLQHPDALHPTKVGLEVDNAFGLGRKALPELREEEGQEPAE